MLIDNVLDAFSLIDPAKILIKIKLHVLVHLIENIRRRGPAVRFSTEIFECFNAIFRLCSVLSNHQAPSRDIALKFVNLDSVKHILSGGYWLQDGQITQAGRDVRGLMSRVTILQKHFGWAPKSIWVPGVVRPIAKNKRNIIHAKHLNTFNGSLAPGLNIGRESEWILGLSVHTTSGDQCITGSWVVLRINEVLSNKFSLD